MKTRIFLLISLLPCALPQTTFCGSFGEIAAGLEQLRACYELDSINGRFCVQSTTTVSTFATAVIAVDREIVRDYAALASTASLFGSAEQICLHHWRRARCAASFLLANDASICRSTCNKIAAADCNIGFFMVDQCLAPGGADDSNSCVDLATLELQCLSNSEAPPTPRPPRPPTPFPQPPHSATNSERLCALMALTCLLNHFCQ